VVAVGVAVLGASAALAPAARAATIPVVVVRSLDPAEVGKHGAVGLVVPGAGSTVTRASALSSLVRGKVVTSLLGGMASGRRLIRVSRARSVAPPVVYVVLPPPGRTRNTHRYPIAIVGAGYRGLLTSRSTRIPGLVSIADVAPTAVALAENRAPPIRWERDDQAAATLRELDRRLTRAHDSRTGATIVLVLATLALAGLGLLLRSSLLARSGLLAIPAALAVSQGLSAAGVSRPGTAVAALAVAMPLTAIAGAARRSLLLPLLVTFLVAELLVLTVWPEVNALAVIGAHPDGGGRFYGVTNEVETLLLVPVLAAAALLPRKVLPALGALAVALVGWSRAGADGGGVVVMIVALVAYRALSTRIRLTAGRALLAAAAVVVLALAFVGLDAATGGSSHVTHAVGSGPGSLIGDLGHRLHVSWKGVTATAQASAAAASLLVVLIGAGLLRPRTALVDALLVALTASLLVNDTPTDVIAYGALSATALRVWWAIDVPVSARSDEAFSPRATPAPTWR
jgi:hypothetical protein